MASGTDTVRISYPASTAFDIDKVISAKVSGSAV